MSFLAACLSRHKDKYEPNQFKVAMQQFFSESVGSEKRKKIMQEWKLRGETPGGSNTTDSSERILYIDLASSENESEVDASELKINKVSSD